MLPIDDAIQRLLQVVKPLGLVDDINLSDAAARVLTESIEAPTSLPPFDASAMDGYAVRSEDCTKPQQLLRVLGTSFAGSPYTGSVKPRTAIRIFTGAALPAGCDAVTLQEDIDQHGDRITTRTTVRAGENVRFIGHDVVAGHMLMQAGKKLSPLDIAWLAACGVNSIRVASKVRVGVFSTGDELRDPGETLGPGQIYDSNRTALIGLLAIKPVTVTDLGCLPDDPHIIRDQLHAAMQNTDLIVTSGGVSVGDADYVRPVVEELGELAFWNVALKPGKPIAVARLNETWFFGLPGNPVSTIITYLLFVATAIDRMCGIPYREPLVIPATLSNRIRHKRGRREFQRGKLSRDSRGQLSVSTVDDQSSNRLASFSDTNALIVVDEEAGDLEIGSKVDVLLLPQEANHLLAS